MNSLTSTPCAETLERLFGEAEVADQPLLEEMTENGSLDSAFSTMLAEEARDHVSHYHRFVDNFLSVSPGFGRFLYMCARACHAREIVEFGTSFGISTIHLAAAVRDNGGGRVVTSELEPAKAAKARENLRTAGLDDIVDVRVGDALDTLASGTADPVDLLLLDGAISLYRPVLDLLEPRLRTNAFVIGENAVEESPGYLEYVRDPANGYLSLPLPFDDGYGNELSLRTR